MHACFDLSTDNGFVFLFLSAEVIGFSDSDSVDAYYSTNATAVYCAIIFNCTSSARIDGSKWSNSSCIHHSIDQCDYQNEEQLWRQQWICCCAINSQLVLWQLSVQVCAVWPLIYHPELIMLWIDARLTFQSVMFGFLLVFWCYHDYRTNSTSGCDASDYITSGFVALQTLIYSTLTNTSINPAANISIQQVHSCLRMK